MKTFVLFIFITPLCSGIAGAQQASTNPVGHIDAPDGAILFVDITRLPITLRSLRYVEKLLEGPSPALLKAIDGALAVEKDGMVPLVQMKALVAPLKTRTDALVQKRAAQNIIIMFSVAKTSLMWNISVAETKEKEEKKK